MEKIRENVRTSFYCRYNYALRLKNIIDGSEMVFYKQSVGSPWIKRFSEAEKWLNEKENKRLGDEPETDNTKWIPDDPDRFAFVELKVVLDRQPLLGTGPLPDWLRNLAHGRNMVALDTYRDNLCLWRCISVHKGSRPDRSTNEARGLAKGFYKLKKLPQELQKTALDDLDKVEQYLNKGASFADWLGIMVYEPVLVEGGESKASLLWLERKVKQSGRHIHHAMCGHGGERWISGAPVDGYHPKTKTIFQYHGCP